MERTKTLIQHIASLIVARANCIANQNEEWYAKHTDRLEALAKEFLPSGSGFDNGTKIDLNASNSLRIVFRLSFHHMNDAGMYDGWTDHAVTVRPDFEGVLITVGGRDRGDIKDYIAETFGHALDQLIRETVEGFRLAA